MYFCFVYAIRLLCACEPLLLLASAADCCLQLLSVACFLLPCLRLLAASAALAVEA